MVMDTLRLRCRWTYAWGWPLLASVLLFWLCGNMMTEVVNVHVRPRYTKESTRKSYRYTRNNHCKSSTPNGMTGSQEKRSRISYCNKFKSKECRPRHARPDLPAAGTKCAHHVATGLKQLETPDPPQPPARAAATPRDGSAR